MAGVEHGPEQLFVGFVDLQHFTDFLAAFLAGTTYSTVSPRRVAKLRAVAFKAEVVGNATLPSLRTSLVVRRPGSPTDPSKVPLVSLTVTCIVAIVFSFLSDIGILT